MKPKPSSTSSISSTSFSERKTGSSFEKKTKTTMASSYSSSSSSSSASEYFVYFVQCTIANTHYSPGIEHWQIEINEAVYEVGSENDRFDKDRAKVLIRSKRYHHGLSKRTLVGKTSKSIKEREKYCSDYNKKFSYSVSLQNCQSFVADFAAFLGVFLPETPAAGVHASASGSASYSVDDGEEVSHGFHTGGVQAKASWVGGSVSGPSGSLSASKNSDGSDHGDGRYSVDAKVDLFKLGVSLGPVEYAIRPNLDTGAGYQNGDVHVNLLGWGMKAGAHGFKVSTPLAETKCVIS